MLDSEFQIRMLGKKRMTLGIIITIHEDKKKSSVSGSLSSKISPNKNACVYVYLWFSPDFTFILKENICLSYTSLFLTQKPKNKALDEEGNFRSFPFD